MTESELDDVRKLVRSKWYWPKLLTANFYGLLLFLGILYATVEALLGHTHPNWNALGIIWIVIAGIIAWAFYRAKRSRAKESAHLNSTLPDWVKFETGGVHLELPNGAKAFHPWRNVKGYREGKSVVLIDLDGGTFIMVPVTELSEPERDSIRQFLNSQFPHSESAIGATT